MRRGNLARGLVAGVAAGLAASFMMDAFQKAWTRFAKADEADKNHKPKPATLKAADVISRRLAGEAVPEVAKAVASSGVHYLTGAELGAIYGVAAEFAPGVTMGLGGVYGAATWLTLDEGISPALGLAPPPRDVAVGDHAYALASHLVFGAALEVVRAFAGRMLTWKPIYGAITAD